MKKLGPLVGLLIVLSGLQIYLKKGGNSVISYVLLGVVTVGITLWEVREYLLENRGKTSTQEKSRFEAALDLIFGKLLRPSFNLDYWEIKTFPEKIFIAVAYFIGFIFLGLFFFKVINSHLTISLLLFTIGAISLSSGISYFRVRQKFMSGAYLTGGIASFVLSVLGLFGIIN